MQEKVDPYLRPLYDALYQIMGTENFIKNMAIKKRRSTNEFNGRKLC